MERFFIIVPFLNFGATQRRIDSFNRCLDKLVRQAGHAAVIVVECISEGGNFAVTSTTNPLHIQVRSKTPMCLKENLVNIAVTKLPPGWKYVAWVDEGTEFANTNWVRGAIGALKRWKVIQLFDRCSTAVAGKSGPEALGLVKRQLQKTLLPPEKLGASNAGESSATSNAPFKSFTDANQKNATDCEGEPGVAWATTRKVWNMMGGLFEFALAGAGDVYIGYSIMGQIKKCGLAGMSPKYRKAAQDWAARAEIVVQKSVGFVKGSVLLHREKEDSIEDLSTGEKILNECEFDPDRDLKKDMQGLNTYTNAQSALATRLTDYVKSKHI